MSCNSDGMVAHQLETWFEAFLQAQGTEQSDNATDASADEVLVSQLKRVTACARLLERVWGLTYFDDAETAARSPAATGLPESVELPDWKAVSVFGRFEIRRELGRGGFGIVFQAFDPDLGRDIALKLPRAGSLASPDLRERFQREARAAGRLDHPNLIPVHESGRIGAIDYLTSTYCPGPSLLQWQRDREDAVPPDTAAGIMAQLAEAMQHAHCRGVLHRDMKPANVLLQPVEESSAPDSGISDFPFVPRVSDFGLARERSGGDLTHTGELLGTAAFMSPEQAAGQRDLDERTDIYALGAILYQLLTGQPPFERGEFLVTLQRVLSDEPQPPRTLRKDTPRDLEAICLKCLEKSRGDRYATAGELAADLQRFLAGEAILARPVSPFGRLLKWTRRYPAASGLIAVLAAVAIAVPATLVAYNRQLESFSTQQAALNTELGNLNRDLSESLTETRHARDKAQASQDSMRRQLYIADLQRAKRAWDEGDVRQYKRLVAKYADEESDDIRGIEWHVLAQLGTVPSRQLKFDDELFAARYSPTGQQIAAGGSKGVVYLVDPVSLKVTRRIETGPDGIRSLDFSPDGSELATADTMGNVQTWHLSTGALSRTLQSSEQGGPTHVAFSVDGTVIAAAGPDAAVRLWDYQTGELQSKRVADHKWDMECLTRSPDQKWFAATSSDGLATLFSTTSPEQQFDMHPWGGSRLTSLDFSHDGRFIAAGSFGRRISVWDAGKVAQGQPKPQHRFELVGHASAVSFAPRSYELAIGDRTGDLYLWNMAKNTPVKDKVAMRRWSGHDSRVYALDYSPDGSHLLSASSDGTLAVWTDLNREPNRDLITSTSALRPSQRHNWDAAVLVDRPQVAVVHLDAIRLWDLATGQLRSTLTSSVDGWNCVGVSPDGTRLAASTESGHIVLWNTESLSEVAHWQVNESDGVSVLSFNHDSSLLAVVDYDSEKHGLRLFNVQSGKRLDFNPSPYCNAAAFSPDGSLLAVDVIDDVQLWDTSTLKFVRTLPAHETTVNCISFHPDGHVIATCSNDRTVRLWSVDTGERLHNLEGHRNNVNWVEFSPDGLTLLSAGDDRRILAWQVASGQLALELHQTGHERMYPRRVKVSPDGQHIVSWTTSSHVLILDATAARK